MNQPDILDTPKFFYGGDDKIDPFGWRGVDALMASMIADVLHGRVVA